MVSLYSIFQCLPRKLLYSFLIVSLSIINKDEYNLKKHLTLRSKAYIIIL
nr:MAG TPA: hypothetical protein [Caudoviricetes sp.]DAK06518.1 MAG TPA: hypothetical protein [Caudoviricetes sp.]